MPIVLFRAEKHENVAMYRCISIAALCVVAGQLLAGGENDQLAQASYQGCLKNMRSFEYVDCRFEETVGAAATLEAALAGDYREPVSTTGRWLKKGRVERFFRAADSVSTSNLEKGPVPHPTKKGVGVVQLIFVPTDRLDNGKIELSYRPDIGQASLLPADYEQERQTKEHPFTAAVERVPAFGWCMSNISSGVLQVIKSQQSVVDGRATVVVTFKVSDGKQVVTTIDPAAGFLPIRTDVLDQSGRTESVLAVQKFEKCPNGHFFPTVITSISLPKKATQPITFRKIRVLELVTDRPPLDRDLEVLLPAGTHVSQRPMGGGYPIRLRREESIAPGDVQKLWDMTDKAATDRLMDTAVPRTRSWPYLAIAGGLAFLGLAYVAYRRLRAA